MSWVVVGIGVVTAYTQVQAGKQQEKQMEAQAEQAESDAKTQLIERKRALLETLAAQNVGAAAQGRTISSISSLQQEDVRRADYDTKIIKGGGSAQSRAYRSAGKSAKRMGYLKGGSTLLSTGYKAKQVSK